MSNTNRDKLNYIIQMTSFILSHLDNVILLFVAFIAFCLPRLLVKIKKIK